MAISVRRGNDVTIIDVRPGRRTNPIRQLTVESAILKIVDTYPCSSMKDIKAKLVSQGIRCGVPKAVGKLKADGKLHLHRIYEEGRRNKFLYSVVKDE